MFIRELCRHFGRWHRRCIQFQARQTEPQSDDICQANNGDQPRRSGAELLARASDAARMRIRGHDLRQLRDNRA